MKIKIIIAYHKKDNYYSSDVFLPIQVGRLKSKEQLNIIGDDSGTNISQKNGYYCEMTAVYWAWKNLKDCDYVGLCHYRRFMTFETMPIIKKVKQFFHYIRVRCINNVIKPFDVATYVDIVEAKNEGDFHRYINNFEMDLLEKLSKGVDMIVPRPYYFSSRSVKQWFSGRGIEHIIVVGDILKEKFPHFYPYYQKALKSNKLHASNMFVMKREYFEEYCNIVFATLQEHEDVMMKTGWCINPSTEGCFSRLSGYLAEMLTYSFILYAKDHGALIKTAATLTPGTIHFNK